jgi:hypothetical protein
MTALNTLLADRSHRYRTADSVMTWWLRDPVEFPWMDWINEPESDQVTELVGELYKPHRPPAVGGVDPNAFCAVTLSVNQSPGGGARLAGSPRRRGAAQAGPVVRRPPGHRPLEGRPAAGPALAAGQRDRPLGTEGNQGALPSCRAAARLRAGPAPDRAARHPSARLPAPAPSGCSAATRSATTCAP